MSHPSTPQSIPMNLYRTSSRLIVAALMPGIEPENIQVAVTADGRFIMDGTLRGELKGIKEELLTEWSAGNYHREISLPNSVDAPLANITYGNGVVVIAFPLAAQTRPAQLRVEALSPTHGERAGNAGHPVRPHQGAS